MIKTMLWERESNQKFNYLAEDLFATSEVESFIEISDLFIPKEDRRKGLGSTLVRNVITEHNDKIIVAKAWLSNCEYPDNEPDAEETERVFACLDKFYTSLNFVSINQMIGIYESAEVYLYLGNNKGKELFNSLIENAKKGVEFQNCRRFLEALPNYSSVLNSLAILI